MRSGRPKGQGANEHPDGHAAILLEPSGHDLHAWGVDAGEKDAGEKSQPQRDIDPVDKKADRTIGQCA